MPELFRAGARLVVFAAPFDQPDNITVSPHAFALASFVNVQGPPGLTFAIWCVWRD